MAFPGCQMAQNIFVIIRLNSIRNPRFLPKYQGIKQGGQKPKHPKQEWYQRLDTETGEAFIVSWAVVKECFRSFKEGPAMVLPEAGLI